MMQTFTNSVDAYREVIKNPSLDKARLYQRGDAQLLRTVWLQRDVDRQEKTSLLSTYLLHDNGEKITATCVSEFPQEIASNELWRVESPSGGQLAVIRSGKQVSIADKSPPQEERFFLEILEENRRIRTVDLLNFDLHGRVYDGDGTFGCLEWSNSEGHLLYVAELKRDKRVSHFDTKAANGSLFESANHSDVYSKDSAARAPSAPKRGDQFEYVDNWGEQLVEKSRPALFMYNIDANAVSRVENVPSGISAATALWAPDDEGLVYVGYQEQPFRLGLIYCHNRASAIYYVEFTGHSDSGSEPKRLSRLDASVRSPRFSPDRSRLIWLETDLGGPHGQCARVMMCDWRSKRITTVIDTVVCCASRSEFPGVYCDNLPSRCWLSDSRRIVFHTIFGSTRHVVCFDVIDRVGRRLTQSSEANERRSSVLDQPLAMFGSYSVLDVDPVSDVIVAAASAPNKPDHLVVDRLRFATTPNAIDLFRFSSIAPTHLRVYDDITWTIDTHFAAETSGADHPAADCSHRTFDSKCASRFETVLLLPSGVRRIASGAADNNRSPLIVMIHGGPHSAMVTEFLLSNAAWCLLGYAVLIINYRGSLGFGSANIESLLGNIGVNDVADCLQAIETTIKKYESQLDLDRMFVTGGSHGGFLTTHLLARLGARVRAGVARNPVTNLYSMLGSTDIPDWVIVEGISATRKSGESTGVESSSKPPPYSRYTPGRLPNEEELAELRRRSPITSVVQNIDSFPPMAILLGDVDMRVPPKQGLELYRVLRSYQRTAKLIVYPQNSHPLSKPEAESDSFVTTTEWFRQFSD